MKILNVIFKEEVINTNMDLNSEFFDIVSDSRCVNKNSIFAAISGEERDGNQYINNALEKGAVVVVTEKQPSNEEIPYVQVKNVRQIYAKMCSRYFENPTKNMKVIAVTGTNGKTTTSYFLHNILSSAGKKCGLISTVETLILGEKDDVSGGSEVVDKFSAMTTPDPGILYKTINKMKCKGVEYLVMETSSHSIKQNRIDGIDFDIAIFTNLSAEHLDYHKNMEDYFETKEKLFSKAKCGVINADCEYGKKIISKYEHMHGASFNEGDLLIKHVEKNIKETDFQVVFEGKTMDFKTKMIGDHNVLNASLAILTALKLGIDCNYIYDGVLSTTVKGRLEKVSDNVYIDYAHTPLATKKTLLALKELANDYKIIALFGCGGERDKTKRKVIGEIVSRYADVVIITTDNPRGEDPMEIIKDILAGVHKNKPHFVIPDRKDAIVFAARRLLDEKSVLILLGKGHEIYQIDSLGKHFFDEKMIIEEALNV